MCYILITLFTGTVFLYLINVFRHKYVNFQLFYFKLSFILKHIENFGFFLNLL